MVYRRFASLILFPVLLSLGHAQSETSKLRAKVDKLIASPEIQAAFKHVDEHKQDIQAEWIKLTEINAPSRFEQERAKAIEKILRKQKLDVRRDDAGNLIATRKGTGGGPTVVVDAHMDTVFQPGLKIKAVIKDGRIHAPGIGDDTRNVEGMLAMIRAMDQAKLKTRGDIVFLFSVEEESSMRGAKTYIAANKGRIQHYIALDGGYRGFTYSGIGINHDQIHFIGPGGHTRSATPPYSATLPLARAIQRIYALEVPRNPSSNLNIGMLGGSDVPNAKASDAWFSLDLRSTDQSVIDGLEKKIYAIVEEEALREKMTVRIDKLSRLAASQVPENRKSELVRTAEQVHLALGFEDPPITPTASNDANIALLAGLPAISTGMAPCDDSHALTESCEIEPLYLGIKKVLLLTAAMAGVPQN
ncbi:MAG TPA: M20/M25/M40 family metallo-hydrolase [Terriglobales bacterium]|nr:M20/M25/M40 family metallo-hydrolase [Terriglobales bacterium]